MPFHLSPPATNGQLSGDLPEEVGGGDTVFSIGSIDVSFEGVKSLESRPSKKDIDKLSQGRNNFIPGFLLGCILDAYLLILCETNPSYIAMPTATVFYLTHKSKSGQREQLQLLKPDSIDPQAEEILLPVHCGSLKHWILLVFNLRSKKFVLYDSLAKDEPVFTDEFMRRMRSSLRRRWNLDCADAPVSMALCAKQEDGSSCGVHLLHVAEQLVQGRDPNSSVNTLKMRKKIFDRLVERAAFEQQNN